MDVEREHPPASEPEAVEATELSDGALSIPDELPGLGEEISEVEESRARLARQDELASSLERKPARSAMIHSFGPLIRWLSSLLFAHVLFEKRSVDALRDASQRGRVVYVMQSRSLLDYMYFNWAFMEHELPLARFANDLDTTWFRGVFAWIGARLRRPRAAEEEKFEALVAAGAPTFVSLERPRRDDEQNLTFSQKYIFRLVRAQRRLGDDEPILLVPMLLLWERRPDPRHISFLDDVFGTVRAPGFFRKAFGYFQTLWQSFFNLGQPMVRVSGAIDLRELLREYPSAGSAEASEIVRERLLESLRLERQVMLGPTGKPPAQLYRELSQRPEIVAAVTRVAAEEGVAEERVRRRVRKFFEEIAARQSMLMLKIFSLVLGLIWYRIYDGFEVDEEGLERVREEGKSRSLILIPSHKSHVDYLIISYLFYQYGLMPPHIAAGVNLSFFPMGYLFRKAGAFFIRRSFKGEKLYPLVFREYLAQLLRQGYPIEFFIEGTRSRTGKLIKPRYGMLDMIIRAFVSGRVDAVSVVPISVGYERVIESRSYRRELLGGEKKRESLTELLKTPRVLTSRYGRLYVQFAEPIDLGRYLERYGVDRIRPDDDAIDALTVRLGHRIIYDINHATSVTPTALTAAILLNSTTRTIDRGRLLREAGFLLRFLREPERDARLSSALERALAPLEQEAPGPALEEAMGEAIAEILDEALELLRRDEHIEHIVEAEDSFYAVTQEARPELAFYRNNIVHLFVPEALLSTAALRFGQPRVDLADLREETRFLSRLFKYEWIYEERAEFENVFHRTLRYFERTGWLEVEADEAEGDAVIALTRDPPVELEYLRRMILTFLEAYALMSRELDGLGEGRARSDLLADALKKGKGAFLRGEVLYYESLSKPTLTNALRLFEDWGVIERAESGRDPIFRLADAWRDDPERLPELLEHLEQLVYQGDRVASPTLG